MTWAMWLAIPVAVTVLAALWTWARSRPARNPSTAQSVRAHSEYLDALAEHARGTSRVATPPPRRDEESDHPR